MACSRKRTNPFSDCNDKQEQDEDRDEYGSSSNLSNNSSGFLHDNYPPSYHADDHQIQTSSSNNNNNNNNSIIYDNNGNGNTDGSESSNYTAAAHHQDLSNGTNHQNQVQQELGGSVVALRLSLNKTDTLIREIELRLNEKDQQVLLADQPPAELPPLMKLKASNLPALFLRIGSWKWEAKNPLDLVAKFYYNRQKLVWEFLFRPLKKKIEIQWSNISAINAYVDDQDNTGHLEIQLKQPPEYYNEPMIKRLKHTQWDTTTDFTQGQANTCRRHTVIFSPGVLDEHLANLFKLDNRLSNLSRQPFPFHDHQFFNINTIINNNNNNTMAFPYPHPVPLSIYHPGAINTQNLVQPETTSFVDNSNSPVPLSINNNDHHPGTIEDHNLVQPATTFFVDNSSFLVLPGVTPVPNLDENAREFSNMIRENTNRVGEEETGGNNQIQDIPAALPPSPSSQQDALNDDQIFQGLESLIPDDQLHLNPLEELLAEANVAQQNYSKLGVMDYDMASINDNDFSFTGLQFNDDPLAFQNELDNDLSNWLSSQYNYSINGNNDDRLPLQSFSFDGASSSGN